MKRIGTIIGILAVFLLSAFALVKVYDKGKDQKPLRYADIPQETIDWINSLGNDLNDIFSVFNPTPRPTPWDNGGDIGKDSETGLLKLEDEYFIIYYPNNLANEARRTLQFAHEAIPRMEETSLKAVHSNQAQTIPRIFWTRNCRNLGKRLCLVFRRNFRSS